jgi:hypothetical protein
MKIENHLNKKREELFERMKNIVDLINGNNKRF